MKLEELKVYNLSMGIAEECWNDIKQWDDFSKNRGLIPEKKFLFFSEQITITAKMLNKYINAIGRNEINDPSTAYSLNSEGKSNSF